MRINKQPRPAIPENALLTLHQRLDSQEHHRSLQLRRLPLQAQERRMPRLGILVKDPLLLDQQLDSQEDRKTRGGIL